MTLRHPFGRQSHIVYIEDLTIVNNQTIRIVQYCTVPGSMNQSASRRRHSPLTNHGDVTSIQAPSHSRDGRGLLVQRIRAQPKHNGQIVRPVLGEHTE